MIGAILFALFDLAKGEGQPDGGFIFVSTAQQERLADEFQRTWMRPPTPVELDRLIESHLREEVLYREALRLGLDRNDTVIRRRLNQKMDFITAAGVELAAPGDAELQAFLDANLEKFRQQGQIAFRQIFLGERPSKAQTDAAMTAAAALGPDGDFTGIGQPTILPPAMTLSYPPAIANQFGEEFARALPKLSLKQWAGPVVSAYGLHLVYVTQATPERMPSLEEIGEPLVRDWRTMRLGELRDAEYQRLRDGYMVEIEGRPQQ